MALVALLAVVAVGTRADRRSRLSDPSDRSIPGGVFDYALTIGIVAAVLMAILVVALARRPSLEARPRGHLSLKAVLVIVLMAALLSTAARLYPEDWGRRGTDDTPAPGRQGDARQSEGEPVEPREGYRFHFRWEVAAIGGALLVAAVAYARSRRRGTAGADGPPEPELAEELVGVLDEALDDLRSERDPRRAVIAAYARMERVLAAHGAARRSFETPLEYLSRILRELRVQPGALLGLTELFETAKFSRHEIDVAMKDEAIAAFESVRDELRSAELRSAELRSAELRSAELRSAELRSAETRPADPPPLA